ncbi:MAG: sigma-70 family RNA polymerase sigma factor, partial [Actinomycetota bacterium]|nr:sigma-70 family RNA polymerase sigma factor [Actinomycetota bacterium]
MAANGSDAAFEAIVTRYRRTLVRHCAGIVGDADAEEAVQDALVRAHGALRRRGTEIRDLRAWLHVIARNAALNVLRSRSSRPVPAPPGCELADVSARRPAEEREQLGELVAAIRALPERQRHAIVMHELEGRTLDEIASSLGTSNGAVRQLLHRARAAMRLRLDALAGLGPLVRLVSAGGG